MQVTKVRAIAPEEKGAKRLSPLKQLGISLIALAIAVGILTRVIAVFHYVTFDIGPDPDQIRDAFVVMEMWQGDFPTLGPKAYGAGLGGFHTLPLYYYLFFPFTLFGQTPAAQAFPNALFSFLSIPLFMLLIYRLLENVRSPKRLFLSGLSGVWYSLLFGEIFISNFQWNPSSIPFFFMAFTLIYDIQIRRLLSWKIQVVAWIGSGILLAVLMSLHASTLFVMPVVYVIASIRFVFKALKRTGISFRLGLPGLGLLATIVALTPYWVGEFGRSFGNTKTLLKAISAASGDDDTFFVVKLLQRLANAGLHALTLVRQVYFWDASIPYLVISAVAIVLVTSVAFSVFRGNQNIWLIWLSAWGLLLLAAASLDPAETVFYYKILMLPAPIALTAVALAYIDLSGKRAIAYYLAIFFFVTLSCAHNFYRDAQLMATKYGPNRLMNTQDLVQLIEQLPIGAEICDPRIARKRAEINRYHYIDTYLTQRQIKTVSDCSTGNYVIHPKRILALKGSFLNASDYESTYFLKPEDPPALELWPVSGTAENPAIARPASPVIETQTAYVYLLS
ncbi:MAG: hypothetical protein WBB01_03315 [Phormidesmis sp.]